MIKTASGDPGTPSKHQTTKKKTWGTSRGCRVQNSGPWDSRLPVAEKSRLFAQRTVRPLMQSHRCTHAEKRTSMRVKQDRLTDSRSFLFRSSHGTLSTRFCTYKQKEYLRLRASDLSLQGLAADFIKEAGRMVVGSLHV